MLEHCCEILESDEFLNLELKGLCRFLEKENLNVKCEFIIFNALCFWIKHDISRRRYTIEKIFNFIRTKLLYPNLSSEKFSLVKNICHDISKNPLSYTLCTNSPRNVVVGIYFIGGYQRQSLDIFDCLEINTLKWKKCARMTKPRSGYKDE